jgi:hypothetical protein
MDVLESNTHSFVVRIWLEETVQEAGRALWHGHVTHVPGGERQYLLNLEEIVRFIEPYLEEMGVGAAISRRVRRWLNRWKQHFRLQK